MSTTVTSSKSGHPAMFVMIVGVGFLVLFIVGLMTQVQTNEAFITGSSLVSIYKPDWSIMMQVPNLLLGNLTSQEGAATLFGWGIELIYLGFIIGYEILQNAAERSGQRMGSIFRTLSWGIVLFNGWTDYNYGTLGGGFWGHLGFAVVTSFVVGFFGTIGLFLIEHGWKRA